MLYWLTGTAGSAAYVGYACNGEWGAVEENSGVPTAGLIAAHDVGIRRFAETENTVTRWTDLDTGRHFAALETPEVLVAVARWTGGGLTTVRSDPGPARPSRLPRWPAPSPVISA